MRTMNIEVSTALVKRVRRLASEVFILLALAVGLWWLVQVALGVGDLGASEQHLLRQMGIVVGVALLATLAIVSLFELPSRIQAIVMPSSDEHRESVDWWGAMHAPGTDEAPAPVESIRDDRTALAWYLGAISIASAIRALGRYLLVAMTILAVVWAFQPFAASLAG